MMAQIPEAKMKDEALKRHLYLNLKIGRIVKYI